MLGINARVEDLKITLVKAINEAKMPACILDYIVTEILNDIRMQRLSEVQKEREAEAGRAEAAKNTGGQGAKQREGA